MWAVVVGCRLRRKRSQAEWVAVGERGGWRGERGVGEREGVGEWDGMGDGVGWGEAEGEVEGKELLGWVVGWSDVLMWGD